MAEGSRIPMAALAALLGTAAQAALLGPDVQLAGQWTFGYPHFEYVTSFNLNQMVWIALDPRQFPDVANETCDVYIVNAKSAAQWAADPSLAGVGPTPVTRTFSDDIRGSRFLIARASQVGSRAEPCFIVGGAEHCIGLGRPLDVVVDCDRNGVLSAPDYIDGRGDEAGLYVVHDTTKAEVSQGGTITGLPVVCSDYRVPSDAIFSGLLAERTYAPVATGMGPLPLVVISHGNGHVYDAYDYLQRHLASYGYVVMSHGNNTVSGMDGAAETTLEHTDALLDLIDDPSCATRVGTQGSCDASTPFDVCSLAGRIDSSRIVWIGHSRGGNGVVWAYDRLAADPQDPIHFDAEHFDADDIALISTMAPVDWKIGGRLASPGSVPFHLIWGAGDSDVAGRPQPDVGDYGREALAFQILERARGPRQSVYIHGGAHGFFHENCTPTITGFDCAVSGPGTQSEEVIHRIVRGYDLPLLKHYLEGSEAARDFLWRPWARFRPEGAAAVRVALEYREADPQRYVVDDYETNPSPSLSSSGLAIVQNIDPRYSQPDDLFEGLLEDNDCHYDFIRASQGDAEPTGDLCAGGACQPDCPPCAPGTGGPPAGGGSVPCDLLCLGGTGFLAEEPTNGLTRSREGGTARGVTLSWPTHVGTTHYYGYRLAGGFEKYTYLSFRVAQLPRHPNTLELDGGLSFTIALTDSSGITSRVGIRAYRAEIVSPYARYGPVQANACSCTGGSTCCLPAGCNPGLSDSGWQAEFETVRIRTRDFLTNQTGLSLQNLKEVRFEFGANGDSPVGRIAIDDVEFVSE